MELKLTPVQSFARWQCPHCETLPDGLFEVKYQDTLSIDASSLSGRFHSLFSEVICSKCSGNSYLIEVNLVASALEGRAFIADNCWVAGNERKFVLKSAHNKWDCELLENVTFVDGAKTKWLARHMFGLFGDLNTSRAVVKSYMPDLDSIVSKLPH